MRIRISFCDAALTIAAVHVAPSLLDRLLFGVRELDFVACGVRSPRGGLMWFDDAAGRRIVSCRIVAAIDRARERAAADQRLVVR